MITIDIPDFQKVLVKHLVLDFNGTIANNGVIITGVKERLKLLAKDVTIHIITADTFGHAGDQLKKVDCNIVVLKGDNQQRQKANYIAEIGKENVIAIGNGRNDALMLKDAAIGIIVIQQEGASKEAFDNSDIICSNIINALDLVSNPLRMKASLRNA